MYILGRSDTYVPSWFWQREAARLEASLTDERKLRERDREQLREAVERAEKAEALLRRLYSWDHMQTAGDGPYWKREIDALLGRQP
jgi:oligoendopeptidase F